MKRLFVILGMVLVVGLIAVALHANATTTFANGTVGVNSVGQPYTPRIGTSTTASESAPAATDAGITDGFSLYAANMTKNLVITIKAHIIVNVTNDAGIYTPPDDAGTPGALNTFSAAAKLDCYVLDEANLNKAWARYPAGDKVLPVGMTAATFSMSIMDLPRVQRVLWIPNNTNVPIKVTYSER